MAEQGLQASVGIPQPHTHSWESFPSLRPLKVSEGQGGKAERNPATVPGMAGDVP